MLIYNIHITRARACVYIACFILQHPVSSDDTLMTIIL